VKTATTQTKEARSNEGLSYGCLMMQLPDNLKEKILDWSSTNVNNKKLGEFGLELTPHITVLYGFPANFDVQSLLPLLKEQTFSFTLDKVSKFENDDDVLKISVKSDDLRALHHKIKRKFDVTTTYPTYLPHITLAYVKSGSHDHLVGSDFFAGEEYTFDEFIYSPPDGGVKRKLTSHNGTNQYRVKDAGVDDAVEGLKQQLFNKYYDGSR